MIDVRRELQDFADGPQTADSPLYGTLTREILASPELIDWVGRTPAGQPIPLLLLGAIQYLLEPSDELAAYYPNLTDDPRSPDPEFGRALHEFVAEHVGELEQMMANRIVQTNEVGRIAALMPGFCLLHQRTGLPLSTVEMGTAAGLLLGWPDYRVDYGAHGTIGDPSSPVHLAPEVRGTRPIPITPKMPPYVARIGIDQSPLDVSNHDDAKWLESLVWPDHIGRKMRLKSAIEVLAANPPTLIQATLPAGLADGLSGLAEDSARIVFHSIAIYQMDATTRAAIDDALMTAADTAPVYRLAFEFNDGEKGIKQPHLRLTTYSNGRAEREHLATAQYHGRWIEWLAD